jgi:hypothetical protein
MVTQRILATFDDYHRRATTIMATQRALLAPGSVRDPATQARHRWELLRVLVEFQIFKHRDIFDPMIRQGDAHVARCAQAMKEDCAALGMEVRDFVTRWSDGSVGENWDNFRSAKLALIAKVERGLVEQRRTLATMVTTISAAGAAAPSRSPVANGIAR